MPLTVVPRAAENGTMQFGLVGVVSNDDPSRTDDPLVTLGGNAVYDQRVLLDLSGVEHVDSTGLEWLLKCHARCDERGGMLVLHSLPRMTNDLVRTMRLDLVLNLADDALAAMELPRNTNGATDGD